MPIIEIPYKPREWSWRLHNSTQRWKVLILHRRAGKTTAALNHLIRDAVQTKGSMYAYIAPFYTQAKAVAWDMLKNFTKDIPEIKINESELRVDFPNGSRIRLFGADNYQALRGLALWGVVFDEYSQQPASVFTEVVRPALSDHTGYAIWIGTPQGMNDFFRLYKDHTEDKDWLCLMLKASESGILSQEELDDMKKGMSEDEYNQELECSFSAALKGAYYSSQIAEARKNRITKVPYQPEAKVDTWWDLGISDSTSIIFTQTIGKEIHVIDFYENNGLSLPDYARVLNEKGYLYNTHNFPHDIANKELGTGRSRLEIMQSLLGREACKIVKELQIKDGIEAARMIFSRCWFDADKTIQLVDALASYTQEWDIKKGMFKDNPLHNWASHAADSFRYLAVGFKDQIAGGQSHKVGMSKYNNQVNWYKPTSMNKLIKQLKI
jgi:hypothetical protein